MRTDQSTDNGERRDWRRFTGWLIGIATGLPAILYLLIVLVDPYDNLPFSPGGQRLQVSGADRHFKPSVARRPGYDSVIVGTSTAMKLHPHRLNRLTGARFANLSMPAASPFEQLRLLRLFRQHHPQMRSAVVLIDPVWLYEDGAPTQLGANVGQLDPDWLYDETGWNDWPRFSGQTLRHARRQLRDLLRAEEPAGHDGYYDFARRNYGEWNLERAQSEIYGAQMPYPEPPGAQEQAILVAPDPGWRFPDLAELGSLLESLPGDTRKILVFPPLHWYAQPAPGTFEGAKLAEVKRRTVRLAAQVNNALVIDFMFHSPVTLEDANYWDGVHFRDPIAKSLEATLAEAFSGRPAPRPDYVVLHPPALSR